MCIFNSFQGDIEAAGLEATIWESPRQVHRNSFDWGTSQFFNEESTSIH